MAAPCFIWKPGFIRYVIYFACLLYNLGHGNVLITALAPLGQGGHGDGKSLAPTRSMKPAGSRCHYLRDGTKLRAPIEENDPQSHRNSCSKPTMPGLPSIYQNHNVLMVYVMGDTHTDWAQIEDGRLVFHGS